MANNLQIQDQADMKLRNLLSIFNLLYDNAPISRADLAKLSGMSPTSITRFTNDIMKANLILEAPSKEKKVGRTATLLTINKDAFYSVGINIDSTYIHVSILNFRKQIVADQYQKIQLDSPSLNDMLEIAWQIYDQLMQESGIDSEKICGIGLSVSGVMSGSDILTHSSQLKLYGVNIRQAVIDRFHQQNVIIENDCNAAILGQQILHPEYKEMNVACLCIGSGVGSAVSYHEYLPSQSAGLSFSEIGHTIVEPDGMLCDCGNRGCLQTFMAEDALITRAQKYNPEITLLDEIHSAWVKGIPWAKELIHQACVYTKMAINNLACVYNPELVIIGGESIDHYWDMFQEIMEDPQILFAPFRGRLKIVPFYKMYQSSIIGVSCQVQEQHLNALLKNVL